MKCKVNVYQKNGTNTTIKKSDNSKANIGVCFSGGGSRALTCAWGQILGLRTINLIDKIRYISSVSGGTWASSIYSYLPSNISDDELLGSYYQPEKLSLTDKENHLNVNSLNKYSLGQVPNGMGLAELGLFAGKFLITNKKENHKWLWAYLVSKFVLKPYGLRSKGDKSWSSSKSFSLLQDYAKKNFPNNSPLIEDFYFMHSDRPFIIMNNNVMDKVQISKKEKVNIIQLPNQVTPVAGGVQGKTPDEVIIGGGLVESYGMNSFIDQNSSIVSPVAVEIKQPYSLIDIVSTSSAFFAEFIASYVNEQIISADTKKEFVGKIHNKLTDEHKKILLSEEKNGFGEVLDIIEKRLDDIFINDTKSLIGSIVPSYNYWTVSEKCKNIEMAYTDGGTLDNTGILGMLAQTDTGDINQEPINLVVFDNTSTPLERKNGIIIAGGQIAPLFGIDFDEKTGKYKKFSPEQKNPKSEEFEATSLITLFENTIDNEGEKIFDKLVKGLYLTSCGLSLNEKVDDEKVNTEAAFYQMSLKTIANPLANITAGRIVNIFYIQNAKILNWQNKIGDKDLLNEIVEGQNSENVFKDFKDFPYYSTGLKIGLKEKESNALSQMWAWAISDNKSLLKTQLESFIDSAKK